MTQTYVSGVAMTQFTKSPATVWEMAAHAAAGALADAGISAAEVDAVFAGNAIGGALTGQHMIRAQVMAKGLDLDGIPMVNTENACASGATAVHLASTAIRAGRYGTVLVIGAESLTTRERPVVNGAMASGVDVRDLEEIQARHGTDAMFMGLYTDLAREYMTATGATVVDFATVSAKNSRHGARNPNAQYRDELTVNDVLLARPINDLLTLPMCAPMSDGAAAAVLQSDAVVQNGARRVRLIASALSTGGGDERAATRAAKQAFAEGGVSPEEITLAEVHDATAPAELIAMEQLMLCAPGEAAELVRGGETALGGRLPVNTSGGLLRKGHPLGATGVAQIAELTWQLRGTAGERQVQGATVGLAHNAGGYANGDAAACAVTIVAAG